MCLFICIQFFFCATPPPPPPPLSLLAPIRRVPPHCSDQNRQAVKGALDSLTQELEFEARKHLRSIRLPIEDSQLDEAYQIISTAVFAV